MALSLLIRIRNLLLNSCISSMENCIYIYIYILFRWNSSLELLNRFFPILAVEIAANGLTYYEMIICLDFALSIYMPLYTPQRRNKYYLIIFILVFIIIFTFDFLIAYCEINIYNIYLYIYIYSPRVGPKQTASIRPLRFVCKCLLPLIIYNYCIIFHELFQNKNKENKKTEQKSKFAHISLLCLRYYVFIPSDLFNLPNVYILL